MKTFKFIARLLVSPFIAAMIIITYNLHAMRRVYLFIKYGGEYAEYDKDEHSTIHDIYLEIKNQRKS